MFTEKQKLDDVFISSKLCVRDSPVHGRGVFAKEKILAREIIERAQLILFAADTFDTLRGVYGSGHLLESYAYNCDGLNVGLALGFASLYNHGEPGVANLTWRFFSKDVLEFIAIRDIAAGEELFHRYTVNQAPVFSDVGWE